MHTYLRWIAAPSVLVFFACSVWAQAASSPQAPLPPPKLVTDSCHMCHGMQGQSASDVFPKLAGQHANYIAKQLENFKTGVRKSSPMGEMAANLETADMLALGRYFEAQKPKAETVSDADLAAMGRYIFHKGNKFSGIPACASCHGVEAQGSDETPRLAGQYASYIEAQLNSFGQRARNNDNAVMHFIVSKMSPLEMAAVAVYVSGK